MSSFQKSARLPSILVVSRGRTYVFVNQSTRESKMEEGVGWKMKLMIFTFARDSRNWTVCNKALVISTHTTIIISINESMVNYCRIQAKVGMTSFYKAIAVLVVLIAVTQNPQYDGHGSRQFSVAAFSPTTPSRISRAKIVGPGISEPSTVETSNTVLRMALGNKNQNDESEEVSPVFWEDIGKKPGNLIFLPIVAIVGIDLLLNIIFITKRSIEYFLLGQAPSTETWF